MSTELAVSTGTVDLSTFQVTGELTPERADAIVAAVKATGGTFRSARSAFYEVASCALAVAAGTSTGKVDWGQDFPSRVWGEVKAVMPEASDPLRSELVTVGRAYLAGIVPQGMDAVSVRQAVHSGAAKPMREILAETDKARAALDGKADPKSVARLEALAGKQSGKVQRAISAALKARNTGKAPGTRGKATDATPAIPDATGGVDAVLTAVATLRKLDPALLTEGMRDQLRTVFADCSAWMDSAPAVPSKSGSKRKSA